MLRTSLRTSRVATLEEAMRHPWSPEPEKIALFLADVHALIVARPPSDGGPLRRRLLERWLRAPREFNRPVAPGALPLAVLAWMCMARLAPPMAADDLDPALRVTAAPPEAWTVHDLLDALDRVFLSRGAGAAGPERERHVAALFARAAALAASPAHDVHLPRLAFSFFWLWFGMAFVRRWEPLVRRAPRIDWDAWFGRLRAHLRFPRVRARLHALGVERAVVPWEVDALSQTQWEEAVTTTHAFRVYRHAAWTHAMERTLLYASPEELVRGPHASTVWMVLLDAHFTGVFDISLLKYGVVFERALPASAEVLPSIPMPVMVVVGEGVAVLFRRRLSPFTTFLEAFELFVGLLDAECGRAYYDEHPLDELQIPMA